MGNISRHTIGRGLRKMGDTRKKKRTTTSNGMKKPGLNSWKKLPLYPPEQLIYMDESGIDSNESFPYGWCEKGQRFHAERPGFRRKRLSILGAICQEQFLAPMLDQGDGQA